MGRLPKQEKGTMALVSALMVGVTSEIIELTPVPLGQTISMGTMPSGLFSIMSMMEDMAKAIDADTRREQVAPLKNPCAQEQVALGCKSASCLKMNLPKLSPECAKLVGGHLATAEPSPSPMPKTMTSTIHMRMPMFDPFFGEDTFGRVMGGGFMNQPSDLMNLLLGGISRSMPATTMRQEVHFRPEPSPAPKPSAHPCEKEVARCASEIPSSNRDAIQQCLIAHYEQLSSHCKCFLHQVLPAEDKKLLPFGPPPMAEPAMRVVVGTDHNFGMVPFQTADEFERLHHSHAGQHIVCMLLIPLMMLAFALLVRRCCLACFATKPQFAAVVPPEPTTIKTVEPLLAVPIAPVKM